MLHLFLIHYMQTLLCFLYGLTRSLCRYTQNQCRTLSCFRNEVWYRKCLILFVGIHIWVCFSIWQVCIYHWSKGSCARVAFEAMLRGWDFTGRAGFPDATSATSNLSITFEGQNCMPRCLSLSWGILRHSFCLTCAPNFMTLFFGLAQSDA